MRWLTGLRTSKSVDQTSQSDEVVEQAAGAFRAVGLNEPASAVGVGDQEVADKLPADAVAARALVRRAIRALEQAQRLRDATALATASVPLPPPQLVLPSGLADSSSALAIAAGLSGAPREDVDVQKLLEAAGLLRIPSDGIPELSVFEELHKASKAAKSCGKVPFSFVDITQKGMLPLWLTPEAIGGKTSIAGDDYELDGGMQTSTVAQLTSALKKATAAPRFFRCLNQWMACFGKYAVAALSSEQLSMSAVLGHISTICRIVEDKKGSSSNSVFLGVLYGEHVRRDWARRVERKDTSLCIETEAWVVNDELLKVVATRLRTTMSVAGIGGSSGTTVRAHSLAVPM